MNVAELSFGPIDGGPLAGLLSINIIFTSGGPNVTGPDLMEKIVNFPKGPNPTIRLSGSYSVEHEAEVSAFVKALKSWSFGLQLDTFGTTLPPWSESVDYIRVYLSGGPWLMHRCNEVRLEFSDPKTPEPKLPPNTNPACYLVPIEESLWEPAVRFCQRSKRRWGILISTPYPKSISL